MQKTDPNDARSVAIAALRHTGLTIVRADDHARVLGLLAKRHRDVARMKNQVACRLHAFLMELAAGGLASEMTVNKANSLLEGVELSDAVTRQRVVIATELVDDITRLETQMRTSKQRCASSAQARPCSRATPVPVAAPSLSWAIIRSSARPTVSPGKLSWPYARACRPVEADRLPGGVQFNRQTGFSQMP